MADGGLPTFVQRLADRHPYAFPYASAVLISLAALAIVLILPYHRQQPVLLFFEVGVALATWVGGWRAGVVALIGGTIASAYFAFQNIGTPVVFRMVLNLVYTIGIIWVVAKLRFSQEALRQSEERVRRLNTELEQHVADRTAQLQTANQELLKEIADRKQAEAAAQRLASIVQSSDDAIVSKDLDGIITTWNKGAEQLFGYTAAEIIGKPVTILIPPERHVEERMILERIRRGESITHYETVRCRKDGTSLNISLTVSPVRNADGRVIGASKIARDITKRRSTERALRDSEELKRRIIESSRDCIKVLDLDGHLLFMSSGGQQLLEIDDIARYLNTSWIDFWQPEDRPRVLEALATARAGKIGEFQAFSPSAKGAPRWWDVIITPICNADGQPEQLLSVSRDITERKQAEAEVRDSEQRYRAVQMDLAHANRVSTMGQLTASIAHEINQPIGSARNNASAAMRFLDRNPPDLNEVKEALGCVMNDIDRTGGIVSRIRDHIRKAPPRSDRFDLNDAINEMIELPRSEAAKNGIAVGTRFTEELLAVEGDRVQLQQVVLNLILNAVEAVVSISDGPRELLICTENINMDSVLVAVRDSGPGIAPENLERVFESFYTTKSNGLGLGLAICRSIVDAHGGRLWAEPNDPRGAVFQFILPAEQGPS